MRRNKFTQNYSSSHFILIFTSASEILKRPLFFPCSSNRVFCFVFTLFIPVVFFGNHFFCVISMLRLPSDFLSFALSERENEFESCLKICRINAKSKHEFQSCRIAEIYILQVLGCDRNQESDALLFFHDH